MPKKMRRGAIRSALSTLVRDNQLVVVDKLDVDTPKTKEVSQMLNGLVNDQSALILVTAEQKSMRKSVNNLADAHSIIVNYLNIRDLLKYDKVIMPLDTLEVIKSIWGKEG
jgi:large subunit ribosomal protein L4